jgi:type VI secretion system protein ImpH
MADAGRPSRGGMMSKPPSAAVSALLERVARAPHAFDYFHLLRTVDALAPERPRLGTSARPEQDILRIGQSPTLNFAPATLAAAELGEGDRPARLRTYAFGMFGPNGPLPLPLTEYAYRRAVHSGDRTLGDFIDLLHHRLATLFFRAWAASEPTVSHDRLQEDVFAEQLASLAGYGMASLRDRDAMPDLAKLHFVGRLASPARNPEGLTAILGSFFKVPVRLDEFVPSWLTLPQDSLCLLGRDPATGTLGSTATAGGRIRVHHHRFRLRFGPMRLSDYERLLPGQTSMQRLVPIVHNFVGNELAWSVNLLLRHDEVPKTRLGRTGRLGWTSWIGTRPGTAPADDLTLTPIDAAYRQSDTAA